MKKLGILITSLLLTLSMVGLFACNVDAQSSSNVEDSSSIERPEVYLLSFEGGEGVGEAPADYELIAGASIELPANTFTYEGHYFIGWLYGEDLYADGETFIMPAHGVTMVAQWAVIPEDPNPSFTASEIEYDKLGGDVLEIPLDLDGAGLFYVELNGEFVSPSLFSYNEESGCLVLDADLILSLPYGVHEVVAITDAETEAPVKCSVTVTQSLKTSFDAQTSKNFVLGKDSGVSFEVGYNTTVPVKLMQGNRVIDSKYYSYDETSFTVSADWLGHYSEPTQYSLYLSNNDIYQFTVASNVIFATDYDVVTIHDTTQSNLGINPLYQYYDNVSIVNGPAGMEGKVLKITPNTTDVTYDCHGYLTLRRGDWDVTWREASFIENKYYFISFDYMTEGTSVGEFYYGSAGNSSARQNLLLGTENDGVVRNVKMTLSYNDIRNGLFLWAKFVGGGGIVYVDNFKIAQLDAVPSLSANGEYNLIGDYSFNFDNAGLGYTVELDKAPVETVYDASAKKLTIKAEVAEKLEAGVHKLVVKTLIGDFTADLRIVDNRVAELSKNYATYHTGKENQVVIEGSFTEGLKLISLKAKDKAYDNGYSGGWDFYHVNENAEYVEYATLIGGLNGTGKLILSGELIDMFWGETIFVAEFSNGSSAQFIVNNEDVLYSSNYDSLVMQGIINGGLNAGSPMTSGMWGTTQTVEPRTDGNGNGYYYKDTAPGADHAAMTFRMNSHVWEWYTITADTDNLYRVSFEYQISGLAQNSVYFFILLPNGAVVSEYVFGAYDEIVQKPDWQEVRYYLNADGGIHAFSSAWFAYNTNVTNLKIQLPNYAVADNKYFMLDEVRIVKTANVLKNIGNYQIAQADEFGFVGDSTTVHSVKVDGNAIAYQVVNGKVVLDKDALNALSTGTHTIAVVTELSTYGGTFTVSDNRVANLTVTDLDVRYGQESAKLAGEFSENLSVVSIARTGKDGVWDRNGNMNPAYITIEADGLVIGSEIINKQYSTGKYVVTFDNGKSVEFTLNGNILYYSDYDEVNVFVDIGGNSVICQDRAMIAYVENGNGNHAVRYTPSNAVLGHSVGAINNAGGDNIIFTFENRTRNNWNWYDLYFKAGDVVFVAFNYNIVTNGKESKYNFAWWDGSGTRHHEPLSGSGYFYMEFDATNLNAVGICAPVASPDLVRDTYMDIDNYAIGIHSDAYLTKYSANVVRGAGAVTLPGSFESGLTVTSVKRFGDNFWDNSKSAAIELGASAVTLSENGLTVSAEVVDKLYGTEIFHVTLSNGDVVRFTLTSNILHYTDYDLYSIHEASQGNIRSCQDTAMWEIVNVNGNNKIKYTPANAVYGHSANGAADNGCMTFSNTSLGNHWWWEFALDTSKTVMVFFDYEVVLGEGKTSYYMFDAICQDGSHIRTEITGSGTFYTEIDTTKVVGFRIYCPSGSNALITDTYMLIDNYGFGYKA